MVGKQHQTVLYSAAPPSTTSYIQMHPPLIQYSHGQSGVGYQNTGVVHMQPTSQNALGKGVHNNLTHILNPKVPLPGSKLNV